MKKFLGLLVGAMALAGTASASDIFCAGVTSTAGSSTFVGATPANGAGTASVNGGGLATLTCTGLGTVPAGFTLTAIQISNTDDAQGPNDGGSAINWTWTMTGGPALTASVVSTVNNETSGGFSFGSCTTNQAGAPAIGCDDAPTFTLLTPIAAGGAIPNIIFTVSSAALAGDGVSVIGTTSASLDYALVFTANGTIPEPATFGLMGAALVGLGFLARKRKA